jgi:hypothetical protein
MNGHRVVDRNELVRLLRIVAQGQPLPDGADKVLSESGRHLLAEMRAATNGTTPVDVLERELPNLPDLDGDTLRRELLGDFIVSDPRDEVSTESNFIFRTARQLADATPERPEWVVHGLAAKGAITELDGKIKGGKSEFAVRMASAVLTGNDFLDRPTRQTPVVYLTEQSATSFRELLRRGSRPRSAGKAGRSSLRW